eukprot:3940772-Rhodomonas_salina.1
MMIVGFRRTETVPKPLRSEFSEFVFSFAMLGEEAEHARASARAHRTGLGAGMDDEEREQERRRCWRLWLLRSRSATRSADARDT